MRKGRRFRQKRANQCARCEECRSRIGSSLRPIGGHLMYADCRDVARYVWVWGETSKLHLYPEELKSDEVPSPIRIH